MKLIRLVQSTVIIESGGRRLLVDPGKYNVSHGITAESLGSIDIVIITHKHGDHFDPNFTKDIIELNRPIILTNSEIATILKNDGIECIVGKVGQTYTLEGFEIKLVKTDHVVRGEEILNFGLVIQKNGKRVYHTSDTRFIDLKVIDCPETIGVDLLLVPIGNRGVVMGIDDALYFTNDFTPLQVIPIHYHSPKDVSRVKPEDFIKRANELSQSLTNLKNVTISILKIGDSINI